MKLERVSNLNAEMLAIGPESKGYKIMRDKTQVVGFKICRLKTPALQILKQDALSIGAEVATPSEAILCKDASYDCLLFGSIKNLKLLAIKLQDQPFGLRALGKELEAVLREFKPIKICGLDFSTPRLMSIINVDSDSFYKEYQARDAIDQIHKDLDQGADIVDIGAASSRPGAPLIPPDIELQRLKLIFDEVKGLCHKAIFSIDTYNPAVAAAALDYGFKIINDISGQPERMLGVLKAHKEAGYVLTHSRGQPENMQSLCDYENLVLDISTFFEEKLEALKEGGFENIILDVGLGFAKDALQNLELVGKLSHFTRFGLPLLIGCSHKSFLRKICESEEKTQLEATLLTNLLALQQGANILRVHDLDSHKKLLKVASAFGLANYTPSWIKGFF